MYKMRRNLIRDEDKHIKDLGLTEEEASVTKWY
jgi:uncharacterized protein YjiS (DUF1127 family)